MILRQIERVVWNFWVKKKKFEKQYFRTPIYNREHLPPLAQLAYTHVK